jgi:hypothetical protein
MGDLCPDPDAAPHPRMRAPSGPAFSGQSIEVAYGLDFAAAEAGQLPPNQTFMLRRRARSPMVAAWAVESRMSVNETVASIRSAGISGRRPVTRCNVCQRHPGHQDRMGRWWALKQVQ